MNILEPSFRLEQFPPEIDVYRVPHDRMKQLVSTITEKLPEIQVDSISIYKEQLESFLNSRNL